MRVLVAPGSGHGIQSALVSLYVHMAVWGPDMCPQVRVPCVDQVYASCQVSRKPINLTYAVDYVSRAFVWHSDKRRACTEGISEVHRGGTMIYPCK